MKKMNQKIAALIIVLVVVGAYFLFRTQVAPQVTSKVTSNIIGSGIYVCSDQKGMKVSYYATNATPITGINGQRIPTGSVALILSDGRSITLPQTMSGSGSGARYADANESVIFRNKGDGVTFTENGQQTFANCMAVSQDRKNLPQVYGDGTKGMTLRLATGYTVDEAYKYQGMGPSKGISGVKFTIPESYATGNNLGTDSYISVEQITNSPLCKADLFLDQAQSGTATAIIENGVTLSVASSTGAGAGNRYEETVYAVPGTNPCMAVRYYIHYGAIGNYPKNIKEFDKAKLLSEFDAIRKTIIVLK